MDAKAILNEAGAPDDPRAALREEIREDGGLDPERGRRPLSGRHVAAAAYPTDLGF